MRLTVRGHCVLSPARGVYEFTIALPDLVPNTARCYEKRNGLLTFPTIEYVYQHSDHDMEIFQWIGEKV